MKHEMDDITAFWLGTGIGLVIVVLVFICIYFE